MPRGFPLTSSLLLDYHVTQHTIHTIHSCTYIYVLLLARTQQKILTFLTCEWLLFIAMSVKEFGNISISVCTSFGTTTWLIWLILKPKIRVEWAIVEPLIWTTWSSLLSSYPIVCFSFTFRKERNIVNYLL